MSHSHGDTDRVTTTTLSDQLNEIKQELMSAQTLITELEGTKNRQQQVIDELKAEILLLQTKLKGVASVTGGSDHVVPTPHIPSTTVTLGSSGA